MKALVYHGPGQKEFGATDTVEAGDNTTANEAYDVFANAAENSALKVVIAPS
jgi:hypothetical protein